MALRGFSKFEQMFRAKLASDAPLHVLKAKKEKEGLSKEEVRANVCDKGVKTTNMMVLREIRNEPKEKGFLTDSVNRLFNRSGSMLGCMVSTAVRCTGGEGVRGGEKWESNKSLQDQSTK